MGALPFTVQPDHFGADDAYVGKRSHLPDQDVDSIGILEEDVVVGKQDMRRMILGEGIVGSLVVRPGKTLVLRAAENDRTGKVPDQLPVRIVGRGIVHHDDGMFFPDLDEFFPDEPDRQFGGSEIYDNDSEQNDFPLDSV